MREFPRLAAIRQPGPAAPIADVAQAVRDELARIDLGSRIAPGAQIAVGAGSRGITDYALIVRTVVEELRKLGAAPFVFAAMGSHGGATAEGKREGAELIHARGTRGLREEIPRVAAVHLARSPILCGVAIVEDGAHNVSHIQAVPAQAIPLEEPA